MRVVLTVVAVWAIVASALALIMARRGHDPFVWWLLGAVLGPLAVPLAIAHRSRSASQPIADRDDSGKVLVALRPGADASDVAAPLLALTAVSGPLSVTLATVLDADAPDALGGRERIDAAKQRLAEVADALAAQGLAHPPVPTCVLFGDPAVVLAEYAIDCGFSLVVLGTASPRSRRLVHGSTRDRLARRGPVPVLLAATNRPDDRLTRRVRSS